MMPASPKPGTFTVATLCDHRWAFLRADHEWVADEALVREYDRYYCRKCLEYRDVPRETPASR